MAVRRESVRLTLEDDFTSGMARAAAATALLKRELNDLSGESVRTHRSMTDVDRDTDRLGKTMRESGADIDKFSGRLRVIGDVIAMLGPGLIPIGAATIPLVTTLANQLGFAALAGGSALLAFHGVGDALKALNDYQLVPTAANLQKVNEAMQQLSPAAQDFVRHLNSMRPLLEQLQGSAAAGLFPGLTEALDTISRRAPEVNRIVHEMTSTLGGLAAEGAQSLAGPEWDGFFRMLETEGRPALTDLGHALGTVTHGFAELWAAFVPIDNQMAAGMVRLAHGFDSWATGLSGTQGFRNFLDYVHQTGPEVLDLLGSLGNMFVQISQAAAPLGGPVLHSLTALADAIASIADSPLGTPIFTALAALATYNRVLAITRSESLAAFGPRMTGRVRTYGASLTALKADVATIGTTWATAGARSQREIARVSAATERTRTTLREIGKSAAILGGLGLVASGTADKIGLTNTATLALAGSFVGPLGAALGGGVGLFLDATHAASGLSDQLDVLAHSNNVEKLQANLDALHKQIYDATHGHGASDAIGDMLSEIGRGFKGISVDDMTRSADRAQKKIDDLKYKAGQDFFDIASATDRAKIATEEYNRSLQTLQATLGMRSAKGAYLQSLIDTRDQIKQNGKAFKRNGDLIDRTNAKNVQSFNQLNSLAQSMQQRLSTLSGPAQRHAMKQMEGEFVALAMQMGMGRAAAQRLADRLLKLNTIKPKPKVDVDDSQAQNKINALKRELPQLSNLTATPTVRVRDEASPAIAAVQRALAALHDKTVTLREVHEVSYYSKRAGVNYGVQKADGGTVPGQRWPYGDKTLLLAAPGEEVISNRYGEADRFRADRAAGRIPAYADGGTVRPPAAQMAASRTFATTTTVIEDRRPVRAVVDGPVRLTVDGAEFTGYMESVADDRIGAHGNLEGMAARAGAR